MYFGKCDKSLVASYIVTTLFFWAGLGGCSYDRFGGRIPVVPVDSGTVSVEYSKSFKGARVKAFEKTLSISTGKIMRTWEFGEWGMRTVGLTDLRNNTDWADAKIDYSCDWQLPVLNGKARLVSLTAVQSDDEGFTGEHLKVTATFEYHSDNVLVQYVIWAYPGAGGFRTQCRAKLIDQDSTVRDTENEGVVDSLPVLLNGCRLDSIGYYSGTQVRNKHETEILEQKTQDGCQSKGEVEWSSIAAVGKGDKGLALVKESHKCVNTPNLGANTGRFKWDESGIFNTGTGWYAGDLTADRYRDFWATWVVLYEGGEDEMSLALKMFDRVRYPVDPERDIYILANTWGSGVGMRASRMQAREDNIIAEIDSQADLGIDVQQIDDGWQGHDFKDWRPIRYYELNEDDGIYDLYKSDKYPVYPDGWSKVREYAQEKGVKLGLWAAINIPVEDLIWNYDHGDFRYYKLDYAHLPKMDEVEELMGKARQLILHSGHKVRINWDVTERNPRVGYFYGREYGNIYLSNRKPKWPKNVVYTPYLILRDAWQLSNYLNLNKFQITIQNAELCDPAISDAYLHGHDYCLAQTLMASPIFFQETRLYSQQGREALRPLISLYRKYRDEMYNGYVFPIGEKPDNNSWSGFQNHNPKSLRGYLTIFRQLNNKETDKTISLNFLAGKTVIITDLQRDISRTLKVGQNGEVDFSINKAPGYLFLRYECVKNDLNRFFVKHKDT